MKLLKLINSRVNIIPVSLTGLLLRFCFAASFLGAVIFILPECSNKTEYTLEEYFKRFDINGFITTIPQLPPLELKNGKTLEVHAKNCGACHAEIYHEWKNATHATALQDIQYQAELTKSTSPKWVCLNCHIPIQNQREFIIQKDTKIHVENRNELQHIDAVANEGFDPEMQQESVTCATCHIRTDEAGKSYVIGAYETEFAPHPVKQDQKGLRNICLRCHSPGFEQLTDYFQCWFKTQEEMTEHQKAGKKDCVECHMPVKNRKATLVDNRVPERKGHMHHWVGGGIPKWYKTYDTLINRGFVPALKVSVKKVKSETGKVKITVDYQNSDTGHLLPTGDPERHIQIRASVMEHGKETAFQKIRIGQEWDWGDPSTGRPAKKLADNRLKPFEKRTWNTEVMLSDSQKKDSSMVKIVVQAMHVRMPSKNAKFMMQAKQVNEKYLPEGQKLVENATEHYPFATFIFKQEMDLNAKDKKILSLEELIELSKAEQGRSLEERLY